MKAFPFSVMTYEPNHPDSPRYTTTWHEGMDLRDYFAAKIMLGLMREFHDDLDWNAHENANMAYQIADAMIKAREAK